MSEGKNMDVLNNNNNAGRNLSTAVGTIAPGSVTPTSTATVGVSVGSTVTDPSKFVKTSGFLPIEREWLQDLFKSGFVDSFRHIYPDEKEKYTWWNQIDRSRLGNRGWRIDLMCVTKGLLGRIKSVDVLDDVEGSDHCPTLLEL